MPPETICRDKFVAFTYRIVDEASGAVVEQIDVPVSYVHGSAHGLWDRIEAALEQHACGDTVAVVLRPADAFGEPDPELVVAEPRDTVPPQFQRLGAEAEFANDSGETRTFRVVGIDDATVTLDGNHPLAGKTLRFILQITTVRDATAAEIAEQAAPPAA